MKIFLLANSDVYPIILLLESHCSLNVQNKVARYLQDVLGSSLFVPEKLSGPLPSPENLRGKVVIKFKHLVSKQSDAAMFDDFDADLDAEKKELVASSSFESITRLETTDSLISDSPHMMEGKTPTELWKIASAEALQAKEEARRADEKAFLFAVKAKEAEEIADMLFAKSKSNIQPVASDNWNVETTLSAAASVLVQVGSAIKGGSAMPSIGDGDEFDNCEVVSVSDSTTKGIESDNLDSSFREITRQVDDAEEIAKAANEALSIALAELQDASVKVMEAQKGKFLTGITAFY